MKRPSPLVPLSLAGFTLMDLLVGAAILSIIAAVCFGSYVTLQRGFIYTKAQADENNNLMRVLGAIEVDVRNSVALSIDTSTSPVPKLTGSLPAAYKKYFVSGARAGEPQDTLATTLVGGTAHYSGTLTGYSSTSGGSVTYNGTSNYMTVEYSGTQIGPSTTGTTQILRKITVSGTTISRTISSFTNGFYLGYEVGYSGSDGGLIFTGTRTSPTNINGTSNTDVVALRIKLSGTTYDLYRRRTLSSGTLQRDVFLRNYVPFPNL